MKFACALLGAALTLAPGAASAAVIYNLTLTATSDSDNTPLSTYNGTGTITLSGAPSATGLTNYGSAAVTFTIDGVNFSGTATGVEFLNGAFYNASFSEQVGTTPHRFDLQTSGQYIFYYADEGQFAAGSITASAPVGTVPEPATWAMMVFGAGMLGAGLRRRNAAQRRHRELLPN